MKGNSKDEARRADRHTELLTLSQHDWSVSGQKYTTPLSSKYIFALTWALWGFVIDSDTRVLSGGTTCCVKHKNGAVLPARLDIIAARSVDARIDLPSRPADRQCLSAWYKIAALTAALQTHTQRIPLPRIPQCQPNTGTLPQRSKWLRLSHHYNFQRLQINDTRRLSNANLGLFAGKRRPNKTNKDTEVEPHQKHESLRICQWMQGPQGSVLINAAWSWSEKSGDLKDHLNMPSVCPLLSFLFIFFYLSFQTFSFVLMFALYLWITLLIFKSKTGC